MQRLHFLLATKNRGKVREIRSALSGFNIEFESLPRPDDLPQPREEGSTFAENARLKAKHYYRLTGIATLAEDSGLLVDALGGEPGVRSARFAPTDKERIEKLLKMLDSIPGEVQRSARFVSALCLFQPDGVIEVSAEVHGQIARKPRGGHGFGYDPVFYYPPRRKTFAEMSTREKNQVSHRARALKKLRRCLKVES
ncbi:RdgB/HAM1 family non-canonical purine NTP pyrophosphatase [Acidobacteria bacterium AH-259-O06]|nr:RdgB/HAM1 family non-canonical purine NTP pyrophosphatase [Acidobacteria bacterium AH-259-O06]